MSAAAIARTTSHANRIRHPMIIRLPFPHTELFPNSKNGKHWRATLETKNAQCSDAYFATLDVCKGYAPPAGHIPLSLLYLTPDKRHRDADNLLAASKALIDGMAKALGIDDSRFKPVLVDWVLGKAPGALVAAVGVQIVSGVSLNA